jgi:hypothetical protein
MQLAALVITYSKGTDSMRIDIKDLSEEDVVLISVMLDDNGFKYDEDYTTIYGEGWTVTGLRIMSVQANALVAQALARWATLPPNSLLQ